MYGLWETAACTVYWNTLYTKFKSLLINYLINSLVDFLFPAGTRQEHMKVEGESNIKAFCKDYVEKVELMFILATVSAVLVILSLVRLIEETNPSNLTN